MFNHGNSWSNSSSTTLCHPANRYVCLTCRLVFPDAQALEVHWSAHRRWWGELFSQRRTEKTPNVSPNPLSTSAGDPQVITNIKRIDFHSMGNPAGSNLKLVEASASGSAPSSGAKNPSTDNDPAHDPNPKSGDKDLDLKSVMLRPNLTLGSGATECGRLEEVLDSESDFDWEDGEEFIMPFYDGDCEATDSERVVPDCDDYDL